jgi:hypothetical protein
MIKPIPRSDVVVRPFTTFKNWSLQNQTYESFLTTENGCPLFTSYTTESGQPCNVDPCFASYSLASEVQPVNADVTIQIGKNKSGLFYPVGDSYYNADNNPVNRDGTYQRLIYNSTKTLFYNDFDNPLELFGIQDYDSGKEIRNIPTASIIIANIKSQIFGDKIQPSAVVITDNSSIDQQVIMADDGYTNLIISNSILVNEQEVGAVVEITGSSYYEPAHDRFGSSVSAWGGYVISGAPIDNDSFSFPKAGASYLYKFDSTQNSYRPIKKFYSPFSQNGFALETSYDDTNLLMTEIGFFLELNSGGGNNGYSLNDQFGISVAIDSNTLAIGSPSCDFCGQISGSGQVYIYNKYKGGADHWGIVNVLQGSCSLDNFGASISISGTKMAIGAPTANGTGRVYIFTQDNYGSQISTSSYWYTITPEDDFCSTIINETSNSNEIENFTDSTGNIFGLEIGSSSYALDITSSNCNILTTNTNPFGTEYVVSPVTSLETGLDSYVNLFIEDSTPNYVVTDPVWTLEAIIDTNSIEDEGFGSCLDISGSVLVIGNRSLNNGRVYMFESGSFGWTRTNIFERETVYDSQGCISCVNTIQSNPYNLYNSGLSINLTSSYFGFSVALTNGNLLVGSPQDLIYTPFTESNSIYSVGSVYLYQQNNTSSYEIVDYDCGIPVTQSTFGCGWSLVDKIYESASGEFTNNQFGYSIAANNNRFVIGSLHGKSYVTTSFDYDTNILSIEDIYTASNGPLYSDNLQGTALVYSFSSSSYYLEKVISKQKQIGIKKSFGYSVAVDQNHVVIGSPIFMVGDSVSTFVTDNPVTSSVLYLPISQFGDYDPITEQNIILVSQNGIPFFTDNVVTQSQNNPVGILSGQVEFNTYELPFVEEYNTSGGFNILTYDITTLKNNVPPSTSGSFYAYDMNDLYQSHQAGNVFYKNGLVVITNTGSVFQNSFQESNGFGYAINFQGSHNIYEHEILCSIKPGEFNVSTNPTAVIRGKIQYDINNDGVFDFSDLDLIMRYYMKLNLADTNLEDDNGVVTETQPSEMWWGNELILTEGGDVLWLDQYTSSLDGSLSILNNTDSQVYANLVALDQSGLLDINGDGSITVEDARILANYFSGVRDSSLVSGNITITSTRTTASDIVSFLDAVTGRRNGTYIISDFLNYEESSSIDKTGSYLAPYITTIGLYQDNQLVAVAKLGQPIKNTINYPLNFLIRYDT